MKSNYFESISWDPSAECKLNIDQTDAVIVAKDKSTGRVTNTVLTQYDSHKRICDIPHIELEEPKKHRDMHIDSIITIILVLLAIAVAVLAGRIRYGI